MAPFNYLLGGGIEMKRDSEGLTNSTAVRRTERARENMMLQNFQSFGTPWESSLGGSGPGVDGWDGGDSMAMPAIQVVSRRNDVSGREEVRESKRF
jgi:hypothetical protein